MSKQKIASVELVPVAGDQNEMIEGVRGPDGKAYGAIRRMCENLGIDFSSQLQKVKKQAWASVVEITTVGVSGVHREISVLPIDQIPMWLATISINKVAEHVRPKLRLYQLEARDALARHFFGEPKLVAPAVPDLDPRILQAQLLLDLTNKQIAQERALLETNERLNDIDTETGGLHHRVNQLTSELEDLKCLQQNNTGWKTLATWTRIHRMRLSPEQLRREGSKASRIARDMHINPGKAAGLNGRPVNTYPIEAFNAWAADYRRREEERAPSLFRMPRPYSA